MNFDARGRLWVASVGGLSADQARPEGQRDKIIVLEDTNGDGKADKTTVFADGLLIPTGVEPGDGGVTSPTAPSCFTSQDTDGDGKADEKQVVLSGFGTEDTHHILHTLRWGHDGLLYFNQSIYIHSHIETPHGVRAAGRRRHLAVRPGHAAAGGLRRAAAIRGATTSTARASRSSPTAPAARASTTRSPARPTSPTPTCAASCEGINPGNCPKFAGLEIVSGRHFPDDWQGDAITNDFRGHRVCRFKLRRSRLDVRRQGNARPDASTTRRSGRST